jgi:predicted deacylase
VTGFVEKACISAEQYALMQFLRHAGLIIRADVGKPEQEANSFPSNARSI